MKILYVVNTQYAWKQGCWFYRVRVPATELRERGHDVKFMTLGNEVPEEWLSFPDVVVYGRGYNVDAVPSMEKFKEHGVKVVYDLDDNVWTVNPDNPADGSEKRRAETTEEYLKTADVVTTTTKTLQKKLKKFNKNVKICPNALLFDAYTSELDKNDKLTIGYSAGAAHWKDLDLITDPLKQLSEDYDFQFVLLGMSGSPLVDQIYQIKQIIRQGSEPEKKDFHDTVLETFGHLREVENINHIPWHSPELYPSILANAGIDIGLCPLVDNEFNRSKSCLKFYEYAAIGAPTVASKVTPYKQEVGYLAKNSFKHWYKKIERLIKDEDLRKKTAEKQWKFVKNNRDIKKVVEDWETAFEG